MKKTKKQKWPYNLLIAVIAAIVLGGLANLLVFRYITKISSPVEAALTKEDRTLAPVNYLNFDNGNTEPTPTPKVNHKGSIPPITDGLAPVISTINTTEPVVFLGIDDGINKQPFELELMGVNNIRATLFLTKRFVQNDPSFFKDFIGEGSLIENHTLDHSLLDKLSYDEQKQEICGNADWIEQTYGRRPVLFRPPGGNYNVDTQRAAAACGMKAVVLWIAKANGGGMQYQNGKVLRPGDIVLMHFRPEFAADMKAFVSAEQAAGLHTELLEDWL